MTECTPLASSSALLHIEGARVTDQLPESDAGRCTACRCWLYYQRIDEEAGFPEHFFHCRRCGRRYAARDTGWTPGASTSGTPPGNL